MIALVLILWLGTRRMKVVPGRFQSLVEMGLDFVRVNIAEDLLGKKDGKRFLPLLTTIFFLVLFMNLTGIIPFMNIAGSGLFYSAEQELPSVGFRAVNEGYTQSYGVVDQRAEAVHLFGGDVDVDRSIVDLMGPEARASQIEMKVRSMRLTLEAAIINGDDTFDPRAFNGLSKRLVPGEDQTIDNGGSTLNLLALEALTDSVIGYGGDKVLIASKAAQCCAVKGNGVAGRSRGKTQDCCCAITDHKCTARHHVSGVSHFNGCRVRRYC